MSSQDEEARRNSYSFEQWEAGEPIPKGWDCANACSEPNRWTKEQILDFMRRTVKPWTGPPEAEEPAVKERRPAPPQAKEAASDNEFSSAKVADPLKKANGYHVDPDHDKTVPAIHLVKSMAHKVLEQAIAALSKPGVGIYARGEDIVWPVMQEAHRNFLSAKEPLTMRPEGTVVIATIPAQRLVAVLSQHAVFVKDNARTGLTQPADCPLEVANQIIGSKGKGWTFPRLRAVISAPILKPGGGILSEPGYDEETGLLLVGRRMAITTNGTPTQDEAKAAVQVLCEPLKGFPFVDASDKAGAVALLVTAVLRPILKTSPMFVVTAPAAGTGKSLLVDIASILATGRKAAVMTPSQDEDEMEKRIGASVLSGDQIINIDNVSGIFRSDQLCSMLTQEEVQVRVLGQSKRVNIPSTSLFCATGNNISVYGDLNRRMVKIHLDAQIENPENRAFDFDAPDYAIAHRAELVSAALTVVRGYYIAGLPSCAPPMGSFEDWSDSVRSALMWAGMEDCRGDVSTMKSDDPEAAEQTEIMAALPTGRFRAKDLSSLMEADHNLREALQGWMNKGGVFNSKSFGRYLSSKMGRRVNGMVIQRVENDAAHGAVWRVIRETEPELF